MDFFPLFKSI